MKVNLARLILTHIEKGIQVQEASDKALATMHERVGGTIGVIVLDKEGNI